MKKGLYVCFVLIYAVMMGQAVYAKDIIHIEEDTIKGGGEIERQIYDVYGNIIENIPFSNGVELFSADLPQSYDSRTKGIITPVKNQLNLGTCWAHSVLSCAETSMILQGYEDINVNYSETHFSYFQHKENGDYWGFNDGADEMSSQGYYGGDNTWYSVYSLQNWQGVANEADFPYPPKSQTMTIDESERYNSHAHLKRAGIITTRTKAKKAIRDYGSVAASYYNNSKYLSENAAYYQNVYSGYVNHGITIVGWDDNYSVENFNESCRPPANGAWLVKNSWGETYGDNGYCWLSYYDPSIANVCFFQMEPADKENIVHSHNGSYTAIVKNNYMANVFCADEAQKITSVGFNTVSSDTYTIEVYKGSKQAPESPIIGEAVSITKGELDASRGFYKIDLSQPVELEAGQYFSIVLKQNISGEPAMHFIEGNSSIYSSSEGESYIFDGNEWKDMSVYGPSEGGVFNNADIKAYGTSLDYVVKFDTRGGTGTYDNQLVCAGGYIEEPQINPEYAGFEFLGWYKNASLSEKYDFSMPVNSHMTLYAKWSSPKNVKAVTYYNKKYFGSSGPITAAKAECIQNYMMHITEDGNLISITKLLNASDIGRFIQFSMTPGEYEIYTVGVGANGEKVWSEAIPLIVTDKTGVWMNGATAEFTNLPSEGAYFIIVQNDTDNRLERLKRISVVEYVCCYSIPKNTRLMLWKTDMSTPLCEITDN